MTTDRHGAVITRPQGLPEFTLGYEILDWTEHYLRQPDGPNSGETFRFTEEQEDFLLWWYALDAQGRFVYRRGVLRRSKGWGKSPFLAAICLIELCGPCRFDGWSGRGKDKNPVAVAHSMPWINLAGVSEVQTTNTMSVVLSMVENSPIVSDYGLDVGLTRIYTPGGGRLVPITASAPSAEGARPSFAVLDETHHWTESNGGAKLARVIRRNLAKSRDGAARAIETTNAHAPGEESVAEKSYHDFLAISEGRSKSSGLIYDSREAPGDIDLANKTELMRGLKAAYGDATWVDLERISAEVYDPGTPPEESRRFYLNQIVAAADSWVAPAEWDANIREDLPPLAEQEAITLGFDGSLTDDSTALVACRVSDGAPFLLGLWEKPSGPAGQGWMVPKDQVRDLVANAFSTYDVIGFFSDVAYWETDVDFWREQYGEKLLVKATVRHAVAWDMRGHAADTVRAVEALNRAIVDGECPHNGDPRLGRHIKNARRRPNRWGVTFGKETRESPHKVDALAAFVLARMARQRALAENVLVKRRNVPGRLVGF